MIKRIQIENFKSFGKVDLEPHPRVNLLIGPNSSGKSNFLEAINTTQFCGRNIQPTYSENDYFENKINAKLKKSGDRFFEIHLEFSFRDLKLEFIPKEVNRNSFDYYFLSDKFWGAKIQTEFKFRDASNNRIESSTFPVIGYDQQPPYPNNQDKFNEFSNQIRLYQPDLNKISKPIQSRYFEILESDCSNLTDLIFTIKESYSQVYNHFNSVLNNLTGEIEKVSIKLSKIPGSFIISIFSKDDKEFDVDEISDGLKYFICILAILHQPNPPKVILLEEPENGIHPRRIIEIYRLITKLAEEKDVQFFITTHSPILLNQFSEDPECVWVFDKVDGISQIKNLKHDILDPRTKQLKEMGVEDPGDLTHDLGDNWLLGLIDGVPPSIFPEDF